MINKQSVNRNISSFTEELSRNLLERHLTTFQENDIEGIMSDFTNESVLITQERSFFGLEEIRGFFAALIAHFPKETSSFELDKVVIKDELIYLVWHGKTPSLEIPFATDTIIIKNNKIHRQTFAGQLKFAGEV